MMESDWQELNRIVAAPPTNQVGTIATKPALSFDTTTELLWIGNDEGYVASYNGPQLRKYTSYRGHLSSTPAERAVRQITTNDRGVLSLAATSMHFSIRGGLSQWNLLDEKFRNLACMSYTSRGTSEVLVAGAQSQMFTVNVERGAIAGEFTTDDEVKFMKRSSRHIVIGTGRGNARLLDMNSFQVVKEFENIHTGAILDMDTHDNLLVSCGYTLRNGVYMLDPLVKLYDLRMQRALPPVSFAGASFVRMHPKLSSVAVIGTSSGQFQKVDLMSQAVSVYHANMQAFVSAMELSPTGDCLAFMDGEGIVQLWGSLNKVNFTEFGNPLEWPESRTVPKIGFDDNTPLNTVGMPYYREELLSAWPTHVVYDASKAPQKIDTDVLAAATTTGYAPYPRRHPRNYIERVGGGDSHGSVSAPKFLSQQARDRSRAADEVAEKMSLHGDEARRKFEVPPLYRKLEIKYSRFGVEDFDFEYYNKTQYSGLETDIGNSYMNPLLQLYRFTPRLRNVALHHAAGICTREECTLCQMGYLFDMMEKASGQNCQATNFLKTLSTLQTASNIGVLEEDGGNTKLLTAMMQSLNRFLLSQTLHDHNAGAVYNTSPDSLSTAVELRASKFQKCTTCKKETTSDGSTVTTDLIYFQKPGNNKPLKTFAQTVKQSIQVETNSKGWCDRCRKYNAQQTRKDVRVLPDMLTLNATQDKNPTLVREYWSSPGWLPQEICMVMVNGNLRVSQGDDLRRVVVDNPNARVYELVGFVADIKSEEDRRGHLISIINVAVSSEQRQEGENNWHLFNDFLVQPISQEDALDFTPKWKMPSVLCYQLKARHCVTDNSWLQKMDTGVLYHDFYRGDPRREKETISLRPDEVPRKGTMVALDAEFVCLQKEETEVNAAGGKEVVRPARLGLARVSVLRGQDTDQGVPFLDDYITTREEVVDFLTTYSGIQPGDLDPQYSRRPVVPLKIAYKRLWILLNLGCVFVGHGLPKDFRIINIHVPKEQVIDTVDLWALRTSQRKLSLKFLAWVVLKDFIQTDNHDSIEDARTALRLFRKYEEYQTAGVLDSMFQIIYNEGIRHNFKPPATLSGGLAIPGSSKTRLTEDANNPLPRSEAGTPQPRIGVQMSSG